MKRLAKMFMVTCVAALALAAVAAGASAATFTASETGELVGTATTNQVFSVSSGNSVTCKKATTTGKIESVKTAEQEVTVAYAECSASFFGFPAGAADVSNATYKFTANGEIHLLNTVTINATSLGCTTTVGPQTLSKAIYTNEGGKLKITSDVTGGIKSESANGCPSGTNGSYTGSNLAERKGGGTISWDEV